MTKTISGGLNGPKRQVNPNNPGDNPLAMTKLNRGPGAQVDVTEQVKNHLESLYQKYKG